MSTSSRSAARSASVSGPTERTRTGWPSMTSTRHWSVTINAPGAATIPAYMTAGMVQLPEAGVKNVVLGSGAIKEFVTAYRPASHAHPFPSARIDAPVSTIRAAAVRCCHRSTSRPIRASAASIAGVRLLVTIIGRYA